jgi:hypothetical protein
MQEYLHSILDFMSPDSTDDGHGGTQGYARLDSGRKGLASTGRYAPILQGPRTVDSADLAATRLRAART